MSHESVQKVYEHYKNIKTLMSIGSLLGWDQKTMLPNQSTDLRATQLSYLSERLHEMSKDSTYQKTLMNIDLASLEEKDRKNIERLQEEVFKAEAVDAKLVKARTEQTVKTEASWRRARSLNDFRVVTNDLEKLLAFQIEEIQSLRAHPELKKHHSSKSIYESFLDSFEKGVDAIALKRTLADLVTRTKLMIPKIEEKQKSWTCDKLPASKEAQHKIVKKIASQLGFNFETGRIDVSEHPFCGGHPFDTRMTTRYNEEDLTDSVWSVIHETGHALYEQGLPQEHIWEPCGKAASLGVHESQSRFYENQICKSMAFCKFIASDLNTEPQKLYQVLNKVDKSFVRTDADEVTYNLHIYIRMELEEALCESKLKVCDLEEAWNESYKKHLGIVPDSPTKGVLQDIHWYFGAFGYFPTYSLGNLIAAELFNLFQKEFSDWEESVLSGEFKFINEFMNNKVHHLAAFDNGPDTVKKIIGTLPNSDSLTNYFNEKYLG